MSITFATGTDYRLVPWTGPTVASGSFTVACRVFPTTIASTETYIILDTSGGATAQMFIDTSGGAGPNNFAFVVSNDAFTIFAEARSPNVVSASVWKHLAATWDGTNVRLYEDGVLVNTNTPAATTRAGNWQNFIAGQMNGSCQDVVAYNAVLNAAQIMGLYRARAPLWRTNIQVWVPMWTAPGLDNLSGVGPNLTLNGSAPVAGPDSAAVPLGVGISPQAFRLAPLTAITAHGDQLETGLVTVSAAKAVVPAGSQLETGLVTAGLTNDVGTAVGSQLQTGLVNVTGGSVFLNGAASGAQLQTGLVTVTASANAAATGSALQTGTVATTETALVVAAGSQRENGFVSVTGGSSGSVVGGQNGGQGRRFGNRLMPAFSRRG